MNPENEAVSRVDTQITVAQGTIKPGTSGLFLSHTQHRLLFKHTHTRTHIKGKQTHTSAHVRAKPGFCTPSVPLRFSFKRSANTHVVGSYYTGL